ncbi:MAG: sigma-70 family RNA polymerase sigma factor [Verrucomicrobia bacterium]|nr:sigma-70 family RNA polymerase sigma factor [Verrucomicrobiota bacterium]
MTSDLELLKRYTRDRAEDAFAELVRRHLGLVYSAALRQVRSPQLAEEVAQSAFTDLAREAAKLKPDTILTAWLYQVTRRTAIDVVRGEARRQLREKIATEMNVMNATADDWTHIEPLLEDAMAALDDTDRTAVLLRYFENKSLREVGATLGTSDDAAQKRVSRAVERLREFFAKRGVTVGASGLAVVISANAVQAAPVGLAVAISSAAALAGTTLTTAAAATVMKAFAMTTLQKTIIGATLVAALRVGIHSYKSRQASVTPSVAAIPAIDNDSAESLRPATLEVAPSQLAESTTFAGNTQPSPTARELYERGLVHEREKRYDEALADLTKSAELLDQGIGRWQWFTDVYFTRSGLLAGKKDYAGAVAALTRMLEFEPKRYSPRFNRARYFTELGQTDAAIADYSAIVEDPDTDFSSNVQPKEKCLASAYEYRGLIYRDRREYDKAVADFTESLRMDPSGGSGMIVYWRRGLLYRTTRQIDKALEDANSLSQWALQWAIAPDSKESDRDQALTAARFGSEIFEHQQPYQLEVLAAVKAKAGDFTQAVHEQERAIKLLTPANEDQRPAMQARLDLYKAGKPLARE